MNSDEIEEIVRGLPICQSTNPFNHPACPPPAVANSKLDRNFKYGRFCGAGYPGLKHSSGKNDYELSSTERKELAHQYYAIQPYDDIDKICQSHDICWILNPNNLLSCNDVFQKKLTDLRDELRGQVGFFNNETRQYRCGSLALDMSFASLSMMENKSENNALEGGSGLARFFTTPIIIGYAFIHLLSNAFETYPRYNEYCSTNTQR